MRNNMTQFRLQRVIIINKDKLSRTGHKHRLIKSFVSLSSRKDPSKHDIQYNTKLDGFMNI